MSVRKATLSLLAAAGLLLSSCSYDNELSTERSFEAAHSPSIEKPASDSSSHQTNSSPANEGCDRSDMKLEHTELQRILENGRAAVRPSAREFKNIKVAENGYDPCEYVSYVVLEGKVGIRDARALAIFHNGELVYDDELFLTDDSLEVTDIDEGFAFKAEESDIFSSFKGNVRGDGHTPYLTYETSDPTLKALRLDLDEELYTSPEIQGDEVDLRGETSFEISIKDLKMLCAIDEDTESFDCARDDGNQWVWDEHPLAWYNPERESVDFTSVYPLAPSGSFEVGMREDEFQPKNPKKLEEKTYRIGLGDMEGQLIVTEDSVVLGTPHLDYIVFTPENVDTVPPESMEQEILKDSPWQEHQ